MAKIILRVEGMSCNGCRGRVEKALLAIAGVSSVNVDLAAKEAVVTGSAGSAEFVQAIEKLGFTAAIIN